MGCHLDAELEGEEPDFDDPIGYNGSDQDYQDDAFSRVRDGLDLDGWIAQLEAGAAES